MSDPKEVGRYFSEKWWNIHPEVYEDLVNKIANPEYMIKCEAHQMNRAVLACKYILENVPKGGAVLDMACGVGYITCYLAKNGYSAEGFDVSEKGIERSKSLAERLSLDSSMFSLMDQSYLKGLKDHSFDAVLGMGFLRYLAKDEQAWTYKHVRRILKPSGKLVITHQNQLFEMFALNDGTLKFWADVIQNYSEASELLGKKSVLGALEEKVKVPKRKYESGSVSRQMKTEVENPLTYGQVAKEFGFHLEKMLYPASHVLPPWLEAIVDQEKLAQIKREICLDHSEDWRAMFMEFEFLAFLEKI